jgi:hypothetical protein
MADFIGELVVGLFQLALEGSLAPVRSRAGCLLSIAAMAALLAGVVLAAMALFQPEQSRQVSLFGSAYCCGILFLVNGIAATLFKETDAA